MCINLIQSEMARTYEVGQLDNLSITSTDLPFGNLDHKVSDKTHIGSGSRNDSIRSLACRATRDALISRKKFNKSSQTMLSFPSPYANLSTDKYAYNGGIKLLPRNLSIDDVMKLVDTEEGDILVLTELLGDDSSNSDNGNDDTGGQTDHSKLLTGNYPRTSSLAAASPSTSLIKNAFSNRTNRNGNETNEEIENRILLGRSTTNTFNLPAVHFKPRLSMISENHGVINEGNGEPYIDENEENDDDDDDDDDTRPLEIKSIKESEPTLEQTRNSVGNTRNMVSLIGSLLSGRGTKKNQRKESMNAKSVHELANE
uniref:Uncharacterized protein n=1 Tax=Setaria digitata TaxID=48799 RepID=A0A915PU68_9BILA